MPRARRRPDAPASDSALKIASSGSGLAVRGRCWRAGFAEAVSCAVVEEADALVIGLRPAAADDERAEPFAVVLRFMAPAVLLARVLLSVVPLVPTAAGAGAVEAAAGAGVATGFRGSLDSFSASSFDTGRSFSSMRATSDLVIAAMRSESLDDDLESSL